MSQHADFGSLSRLSTMNSMQRRICLAQQTLQLGHCRAMQGQPTSFSFTTPCSCMDSSCFSFFSFYSAAAASRNCCCSLSIGSAACLAEVSEALTACKPHHICLSSDRQPGMEKKRKVYAVRRHNGSLCTPEAVQISQPGMAMHKLLLTS